MIYIERRKDILNTLMKKGSVNATELSQKYGVGLPTIRRDLKYLAEEYGIELVYGGAVARESLTNQRITEMNIAQKKLKNLTEKKMIAEKAAALINDGDTIALNSGSTVELILDYLEGMTNLNVLTLSMNVAVKAATMPGINVYMPGGRLRKVSGAFIGKDTNAYIEKFNVDKAFMGVLAVSLSKGVTHPSLEEIDANQVLADVSSQCYLVADYSKFDKVSLAKMFDFSIFKGFIVDDKVPEAYLDYARKKGIQII